MAVEHIKCQSHSPSTLARLNRVPSKITFADIISNYDLVVHNIAYICLQRANVLKESIKCTFTNLQDVEYSVRTVFGDSD